MRTAIESAGTHARHAVLAAGLGLALLAAASAQAVEVTLQNDSSPVGGGGTSLPTFLSGEQVAVWLTAGNAGDIVAVQVDWRSAVGGAPPSVETAIHIYAGGVFPTPGALLASVSSPTLIDPLLNEYRFLDPGLTVPLELPVAAGATFVVALEFANTNYGGDIFTPSVVYDGDGCQSGLGAALPNPGSWTDSCALGIPGDIVIRAIVDETIPVPALGGGLLALLAGFLVLGGVCATAKWLPAQRRC